MIFIDTNYFLRFLLGDVKSQHDEAEKFFLEYSGSKTGLFTSTIVFFEVYWVINAQFERDKSKVSDVLDKLLRMVFIEVENYNLLVRAVGLYKTSNLGLVDIFNMVYAQSKNAFEFKTFDKKLIKKLLKNKN